MNDLPKRPTPTDPIKERLGKKDCIGVTNISKVRIIGSPKMKAKQSKNSKDSPNLSSD